MADDSTFRQQLQHRISSYLLLESQIEVRLAELQQELETFSNRRQSAEALYQAEFGESFDVEQGSEPEPAQPRIRSGPMSGMSWADAITRVLRERGALHVKEIWNELESGGFRTDARDPLRSIVSIAVREPGIVKVDPNTYALNGLGRNVTTRQESEEVQS